MRGAVKYLTLLFVGILSASCIFDPEPIVMPTNEVRSVMFTVSLEGGKTRAMWEEEYPAESGVAFDYRINPEMLHVVVLAEDNTRLGTLLNLDYYPINDSHTQFQFIGEMPKAFVEHFNSSGGAEHKNYKFMVLANCHDVSSELEHITYNYSQLDPTSEHGSIPMWGVQQVDMSPLVHNQMFNIGEIWLLRAAAKVEVKLSDKLKQEGVTIVSSTLKYYNQTGYCLPEGWAGVPSTRRLDQENCMRLYRHAAVNLPFVRDDKTGDYFVYLCEYDNKNYPGEYNKISLEFNMDGEIKAFEDAISFCQYSDGEPVEGSHYNIVRNHIYEFKIRSIAGSNLMLEYHVADWTTEDWDGNGAEFEEHDLSYPTYHNPVVPYDYLNLSSTDQTTYSITQEPVMSYNAGNPEAGGFSCYFQILAPEAVEWKPVFMGSKENYRIRVYRVDKNLVQASEPCYDTHDDQLSGNFLGACASGEWFRIVVFPLSEDGANSTIIEFGVSYYQAWTDQYVNLYVNGEYNNIRWPNSGNNPKIINIRHISAH